MPNESSEASSYGRLTSTVLIRILRQIISILKSIVVYNNPALEIPEMETLVALISLTGLLYGWERFANNLILSANDHY